MTTIHLNSSGRCSWGHQGRDLHSAGRWAGDANSRRVWQERCQPEAAAGNLHHFTAWNLHLLTGSINVSVYIIHVRNFTDLYRDRGGNEFLGLNLIYNLNRSNVEICRLYQFNLLFGKQYTEGRFFFKQM